MAARASTLPLVGRTLVSADIRCFPTHAADVVESINDRFVGETPENG